jgi:hypothetical protein
MINIDLPLPPPKGDISMSHLSPFGGGRGRLKKYEKN